MSEEEFVHRAHAVVDERVKAGGGRIDGFYYCPHHPTAEIERYRRDCDCRKPGPGMLRAAARPWPRSVALVRGRRQVDRRAGRPGGRRQRASRSHRLRRSSEIIAAAQRRADLDRRRPDRRDGVDPARAADDGAPDVTGDRLLRLVDDFAGVRVLVLGDLLVDEFIYGRISRVSREAPVLILEHTTRPRSSPAAPATPRTTSPRSAAAPMAVGMAGDDEPGRLLRESMRRASTSNVDVVQGADHARPKTRILAGGVHSAKQQVVRVDRTRAASDPGRRGERAPAPSRWPRADALIVSDYGTASSRRPSCATRSGALRGATRSRRSSWTRATPCSTIGVTAARRTSPRWSSSASHRRRSSARSRRAGRSLLERTAAEAC